MLFDILSGHWTVYYGTYSLYSWFADKNMWLSIAMLNNQRLPGIITRRVASVSARCRRHPQILPRNFQHFAHPMGPPGLPRHLFLAVLRLLESECPPSFSEILICSRIWTCLMSFQKKKIYIHIYIYCMYICIYIYAYMYIHMYIHRALFPMLQELRPASRCGLGMQHCDCSGCIDYRRGHGRSHRSHVIGPWALHMGGPATGGGFGCWKWWLLGGWNMLEHVGTCWNMLSARFLRLISDFFVCDHLRHLLYSHIRILCGCSFSLLLMRRTESERINISHMSEPCLTSFWTFQPWQQDGMSLFGGVYSGFIVVIILPYVPMTSTCHYVILICFNLSLRIRN